MASRCALSAPPPECRACLRCYRGCRDTASLLRNTPARAKIKIAAELYPFRFLAARPKAKKDGGGWDIEVFE